MPSSRAIVSAASSTTTSTGTISCSNLPSSVARCARRCDSAANASLSSRVMLHFSAIISAEIPWGTRSYRASIFGPNGMLPGVTDVPIGTRVMCSTPAATTTS